MRELISAWLPAQPWAVGGPAGPVELIGTYRFDDPGGEVGIETHLLRIGDGRLFQVPLTYRGAPLVGADAALVGTAEHTVLGRRWIYDGCADPVHAAALATAILTGGREAEQWIEHGDGRREQRVPSACVAGSGTAGAEVAVIDAVVATDDVATTTITASGVEIVLRRVLDGTLPAGTGESAESATLTGTWAGSAEPTPLAYLRRGLG